MSNFCSEPDVYIIEEFYMFSKIINKPFKMGITKCDFTGQVQTFMPIQKCGSLPKDFLERYAFSLTYVIRVHLFDSRRCGGMRRRD